MMVGEFNFGEVFIPDGVEKGTPTIQIAFILFLLLVAIIIMNLLIGLAIRYSHFKPSNRNINKRLHIISKT